MSQQYRYTINNTQFDTDIDDSDHETEEDDKSEEEEEEEECEFEQLTENLIALVIENYIVDQWIFIIVITLKKSDPNNKQ